MRGSVHPSVRNAIFSNARQRMFSTTLCKGRAREGESGYCGAWRGGGGQGDMEGGDERGRMHLTFGVAKLVLNKIQNLL